jgi:hypothetical protein
MQQRARFDERIDWFRIIVDIRRNGHTYLTIAATIGTVKSNVRNIANGTAPRYEFGERLIAMWAELTGKSPENAPRVSRYSYRS